MTPFGKNMVKLPDEALETSSGTDPKYLLLFIRQEGGEIFVECINLWLPRSAVVPLHVHPAPSFFVQLGDPTCIGRVLLSLTTLKVCASCRSPRNPPPPQVPSGPVGVFHPFFPPHILGRTRFSLPLQLQNFVAMPAFAVGSLVELLVIEEQAASDEFLRKCRGLQTLTWNFRYYKMDVLWKHLPYSYIRTFMDRWPPCSQFSRNS